MEKPPGITQRSVSDKKKTCQKRKTFQYFQKIDNIIPKRHDINRPFTSGSSLRNHNEAKFSTKVDENMIDCTSLQTDEESSTMSYEISFLSPSSTDTAESPVTAEKLHMLKILKPSRVNLPQHDEDEKTGR